MNITIPDEHIPKGYRLTGEWRAPKHGECFLDSYGQACKVDRFPLLASYPILEKIYTLPFVPVRGVWVYQSCNRTWYASHIEPREAGEHWCGGVVAHFNDEWELKALFIYHGHPYVEPPADGPKKFWVEGRE